MTFTDEQNKQLAAPLDPKHVKSRAQGGQSLSYVEAWHVIAEANRIFGFDGWSRETDEIKCVAEFERKIGQRQDDGWSVTYTTRVRVRVGNVTREGCGAGHGIDRDRGQAHESAIKEAESDAMKRALMTFGNQFGLALYDKQQSNVAEPTRYITDAQRSELIALAQARGVALNAILKFYKIPDLRELLAVDFDGAKQGIQNTPSRKEAVNA